VAAAGQRPATTSSAGGEELAQLVAKYPTSATIGIAQAAWAGEQGRFADALAQYDRCSGLENQTMEQAMFIGAQKAVLQTYLKQPHAPSRPRLGSDASDRLACRLRASSPG
jgi:hypothetical protein